jgi:hypothetical protein
LRKFAENVIALKGGMTAKPRDQAKDAPEAIPDEAERVNVVTGRYLGDGFDDARLDTVFLTMPISWRGTARARSVLAKCTCPAGARAMPPKTARGTAVITIGGKFLFLISDAPFCRRSRVRF